MIGCGGDALTYEHCIGSGAGIVFKLDGSEYT